MRLEPIGVIEDLDEIDYEPITVPIVGYTNDKEQVTTDITFRAAQSLGSSLDLIRQMGIDDKGKPIIPIAAILEFLDAAILDTSRVAWDNLIRDEEVNVEQTTLVELYKILAAQYANRPTQQQSASHNGRTTPKKTSRAAASAKGSTSRASVSV